MEEWIISPLNSCRHDCCCCCHVHKRCWLLLQKGASLLQTMLVTSTLAVVTNGEAVVTNGEAGMTNDEAVVRSDRQC